MDAKKEFDSKGNPIRVVFNFAKVFPQKNLVIQDYKGKPHVCLREFFRKNGRQIPTKGIMLPKEQWSNVRKNIGSIQEAVLKKQSQLRAEEISKHPK